MNQRVLDKAKEKFQEKMKIVEEKTGKDVETYYMLQFGPESAKVIVAQLEATFISGFFAGLQWDGK